MTGELIVWCSSRKEIHKHLQSCQPLEDVQKIEGGKKGEKSCCYDKNDPNLQGKKLNLS